MLFSGSTDLTGAPFPAGQSITWRWAPNGLRAYATGFTLAIDLAFVPMTGIAEQRGSSDGSTHVSRRSPCSFDR